MHILVNGLPFCESECGFLILHRIDDTLPDGPHNYPLNVFTCEPASVTHAETMVEVLRSSGKVVVELSLGPCPAQQRRNIERANEAATELNT